MVSTTEVATNGSTPSLPPGQYRLVGFDLDLTGRRLIDEIVNIAAYTPTKSFSQFVMPFGDLNFEAKYRHLLRVITVGRYRMLKSDKTGKVLKTKSEISAVTDFVQWLEGQQCDNIVLLTHETRKTVPLFLLEVLKKYNLYDRFCKVVKGFANTYLFAEAKCAETVKSYSLFALCNVLLDKNEDLDCALDRARLTYQIVQHLCASEEGSGDGDQAAIMSEAIRQIANSIAAEELDLIGLKELVERQNSLRPIFGVMIRSYRFERYRAGILRRMLAEANLTYTDLEAAWKENEETQRESLTKLVESRVKNVKKPQDLEDLIEILIGHFDPKYKPKRTTRKSERSEKNATDQETTEDKPSEDKSKNSSGKSSPGKFASATSSPAKAADESKDVDTSR